VPAMTNVELVTRYLHAIAAGEPFVTFLAPEMVFEELPNRVFPRGARSDVAAMQLAAERGKQLLRSQSYEILGAIADGERVALEVAWTGVLAIGFGTKQPGDALRARCAMIFECRAGKIVAQRNYDCYEEF
jgi:ketosteroid isomerase-like protein